MEIFINDNPQQLPDETTVAELLQHLEMKSQYVAVERNRELVPRRNHAKCVLQAGDRLEIVTLVGGG